MKKYIFSTLVAMTLACGAYAGNNNGNNGNGNNGNNNGQTHSVPDTGSTAALLGLSAVALAVFAKRKFELVK
jgi:hypothetical protein